MVLKPDQQHIKDLLTETITLLCCNGLHFKSEFSIDALIGITLDQEDVFLISIKETFQNNRTGVKNVPQSQFEVGKECSSSLGQNLPSRSLATNNMSQHAEELRKPDLSILEDGNPTEKYAERNFVVTGCRSDTHKQLSNKRKHRIPLKFDLVRTRSNDSSSEDKIPAKRTVLLDSLSESEVHGSKLDCTIVSPGDCFENSWSKTEGPCENETMETVPNCSVHDSNPSLSHKICENDKYCVDKDGNLVFIKQEPIEKSLLPANRQSSSHVSRHAAVDEINTRLHQRSSLSSEKACSMNSVFLQLQDSAGCSSWSFMESSGALQMSYPNRHHWHLQPVVSQLSEGEVGSVAGDGPHLTVEELAIARAILSMRGNFVSLGCLKANRQSLRNYTREHLIAVMEKISSPLNQKLFIGLLYTFGTTRIFFKCPPSEVTPVALNYFGFDPLVYAENYNEPVIVDKNIRDPVAWVEKILDKSPFK